MGKHSVRQDHFVLVSDFGPGGNPTDERQCRATINFFETISRLSTLFLSDYRQLLAVSTLFGIAQFTIMLATMEELGKGLC